MLKINHKLTRYNNYLKQTMQRHTELLQCPGQSADHWSRGQEGKGTLAAPALCTQAVVAAAVVVQEQAATAT